MNRLRGLDETYVSIVLSIIIGLLLAISFHPQTLHLRGLQGRVDEFFAFCLGMFIAKYLHEASVSSHRFRHTQLTGDHPTMLWHVILFLSRLLNPVVVFFFLSWFLMGEHKEALEVTLALSAWLFLTHASLYLAKDWYLYKLKDKIGFLSGARQCWVPADTITTWIAIDAFVIVIAFILVIIGAALLGLRYLELIEWKERVLDIIFPAVKILISLTMLGQTIADYWYNRRFFFNDLDTHGSNTGIQPAHSSATPSSASG